MLEIYPKLAKADYKCPDCGCQLSDAHSVYFEGTLVLADIECTCCEVPYFQLFPASYQASSKLAFTKNGAKAKHTTELKIEDARRLIDNVLGGRAFEPEISISQNSENKNAIILNCLSDSWYSSFRVLLNAQELLGKYPERGGLIVIIPKPLAWLVPEAVSEIWSVDIPVSEFGKKINHLDAFVKNQFQRFDSVSLADANVRVDIPKIDIESFTKIKPFNKNASDTTRTNIAFIWSDDTFWLSNRWERALFSFTKTKKMYSFLRGYFVWSQMQKLNKLAKILLNNNSNIEFALYGNAKAGKANKYIQDFRKQENGFDFGTCEQLAASQIVLKLEVEESLLPSLLAHFSINIAQTVSPNSPKAIFQSIKQLLFLD